MPPLPMRGCLWKTVKLLWRRLVACRTARVHDGPTNDINYGTACKLDAASPHAGVPLENCKTVVAPPCSMSHYTTLEGQLAACDARSD
eukprot:scaffold6551_cov118-Isochrysis_galbana.AAC.2